MQSTAKAAFFEWLTNPAQPLKNEQEEEESFAHLTYTTSPAVFECWRLHCLHWLLFTRSIL
eukprot:COSAG06_NODE_4609_length_4102_cov_63.784911_3_plen_61_part_00